MYSLSVATAAAEELAGVFTLWQSWITLSRQVERLSSQCYRPAKVHRCAELGRVLAGAVEVLGVLSLGRNSEAFTFDPALVFVLRLGGGVCSRCLQKWGLDYCV